MATLAPETAQEEGWERAAGVAVPNARSRLSVTAHMEYDQLKVILQPQGQALEKSHQVLFEKEILIPNVFHICCVFLSYADVIWDICIPKHFMFVTSIFKRVFSA